MALGADALLDWAKLKEYFPDYDDADQAFGELPINSASRTANRISRRSLKARDYTTTLDGEGGGWIVLPEYPVNSITSLFVDVARLFGPSTEISSVFYTLDSESGRIYSDTPFPKCIRCIKVIFNAGYVDAAVPEDLEYAVVEVVRWNWSRIRSANIGVRRMQNPDGIGTDFELTTPMNAQRVFEEYRRIA